MTNEITCCTCRNCQWVHVHVLKLCLLSLSLSLSLSLFLSEVSTYIQFFVILVKIFAYACWLSPVVHTVLELCLVFAFLFLFPFIHWLLKFWEVHWWGIELGVRGRERERALVERWPLCRLWYCCDRERERKLVTYTHTCLLSLPLFMEYDSTKERSVDTVLLLYMY